MGYAMDRRKAKRYLVKREHPLYVAILQSSRPGRMLSEKDKRVVAKGEEFEEYLDSLTDAELYSRFRGEQAKAEFVREYAVEFSDEVYSLIDAHWAKQPYWTVHEAALLLLGKEPTLITEGQLSMKKGLSRLADEYSKLSDTIKRAQAVLRLEPLPSPESVVDWALKSQIEVPDILAAAISEIQGGRVDWEKAYNELATNFSQLKQENKVLSESLRDTDSSVLSELRRSGTWVAFFDGLTSAARAYPEWQSKQSRIQRTGNLKRWLVEQGFADRQADMASRILAEIFEK